MIKIILNLKYLGLDLKKIFVYVDKNQIITNNKKNVLNVQVKMILIYS